MKGELVFRKANQSDIDAIGEIYERTHDAEEAGLATIGWERGIYPTREVAETSIARDDMYVAELDGKVVATGIINNIQVDVYETCDWKYKAADDKVSVLHTMMVDPGEWSKGIGTAFAEYYEALSGDLGCEVLRIDTNARNKAARKMYEKLGYIETAIVPTVFNGIDGVDLVLLEKKL